MARLYAMLSALCSLVFLTGLVAGVVVLFINWKIAIGVIVASLLAAPIAKMFDRAKLRAVYGRVAGDDLTEADWSGGKKDALGSARIDREAWELKKVRKRLNTKQDEVENH